MGNRKARELQLKQMREAELQSFLSKPRPATQAASIGLLRMQLIVCPSFEEAKAWDITAGPEEWRLYRSRVVETYPEVILLGYERQPFAAARLSAFFGKVIGLSLPLVPILNGYAGIDGTSFQLALFGDLDSSWRFRWWSDPPPQWSPLIDIANEMIKAFSLIEG